MLCLTAYVVWPFFAGNLQSHDRVSIFCVSFERQFISYVSDVFTRQHVTSDADGPVDFCRALFEPSLHVRSLFVLGYCVTCLVVMPPKAPITEADLWESQEELLFQVSTNKL